MLTCFRIVQNTIVYNYLSFEKILRTPSINNMTTLHTLVLSIHRKKAHIIVLGVEKSLLLYWTNTSD